MLAQSSIRWIIGTAGADGGPRPLRTSADGSLLVAPERPALPQWLAPVVGPSARPGSCRLVAVHVATAHPLPLFVQVFDAATVPGAEIGARVSIAAARTGIVTLAGGIPLLDGLAVAFSSHPARLVPVAPETPVVVNLAILP